MALDIFICAFLQIEDSSSGLDNLNISTRVMNIILSLVLILEVISIVELPLLAYGQSASSSSSDSNTAIRN